jgi:uncharacterized protein
MNLYDLTVPHVTKSLQNLDRWIEKAHDFAKAKKFEPNDLLPARLAPDQLPLLRQVQIVCDNAKFIVARPLAKEAPSHPDTEKTWDELRARMKNVREWASQFKPADFEKADEHLVTLPWMPGKALTARDYILEFGRPNFDFHLVTAYAILRHNGVDLGKPDYIGGLPFRDL